MSLVQVDRAEAVLMQRLRTVREVLGPSARNSSRQDAGSIELLIDVIDDVRRKPAAAWLLVVGLTGAFPEASLVRSVRRAIALKDPEDAAIWLLDAVTPLARRAGNAEASLRVVSDRPIVDVDFTAKHDVLTGVQRVVREVMARWHERRDVEPVVWAAHGGAYRALHDAELARLLGGSASEPDEESTIAVERADEIVVPWGVPVVLIEVPPAESSVSLAALAELTGNSVRMVGHDSIPISSAETVPLAEPEKFGRYLDLVKHADRLAGVSRSAATEFEGFTRALGAQGLSGPVVRACPLPHTALFSRDEVDPPAPPERPLVVCVGSVGRRKNQVALVEAAEVLWREGLEFEVRLLGHVGRERSPLEDLVPELRELGRPLVVESGVSDARIAGTLAHARCVVFPSLHEGFGLPVVEALSHGVPVITSDFGSLRESAHGQGGLLVDPEDVDALSGAIRSLLTDDDLHARLVAAAAGRPVRTWSEYADDLWETLLA